MKSNVADIMDEIRQKIIADVQEHKDKPLQFNPYKADANSGPTSRAGELLYSEELRVLNEKWAFANLARRKVEESITSHRPGLIGKIIVKFKRKFASSIWDSILKPYFEEEQEFSANVVRFLNQTSKYVDQRDASNFWELIRKIDVDVTNSLERIERIKDELSADLRTHQKISSDTISSIGAQQSKFDEKLGHFEAQLKVLDSVAKGLESIVARASKSVASTDSNSSNSYMDEGSFKVKFNADQSYCLLENRFRGSEDLIRDRVSIYLPYYKNAKMPVLEIGGGRGELQKLFKENNINSYSIDIDQAMVDAGIEKGVDVRFGDGIAHLASLPDKSLSGVIAIQVVEHLTQMQLQELFKLCAKKVINGGKIIFETINPRSVVALSSNYFRDPTHIWPLHPDTLAFQMDLFGLKNIETRFLSEIPQEAGMEIIESGTHMPPLWQDTLLRINRNFKRLHDLLYGYQDYCVVAEVRE
jgi:O-antigen chain-terminating methyltransferase